MCEFGKTCGLCDCFRAHASAEQLSEMDEMDLQRAEVAIQAYEETK